MATKHRATSRSAAERDRRRTERPRSDRGRARPSHISQSPRPARDRRRLRVVYDVNGPRVRLGIAWFVLEVVALVVGPWGIAVLYSMTAGIAALQTAKTWQHAGARPHRVMSGVGAVLIGLAGAVTTGLVGAAILVVVAGACFLAYAARARGARSNPVVDASFTLRCALFPGFAAACMVVAARFELGAVVGLVFVVGAYETGDYLVGSGARNPLEGPIAGMIAAVVTTFAVAAVAVEPFEFPHALVFAGLAAVLCPAGQLVASAILPSADAPASALRRLDSLLLLAPAWAFVVGLVA